VHRVAANDACEMTSREFRYLQIHPIRQQDSEHRSKPEEGAMRVTAARSSGPDGDGFEPARRMREQ
jgi:hypothetical protein